MKQLLIILSLVFFASCVNAPDNIVHSQKSEKGGWVIDARTQTPVQEDVEFVQLSPTWGQSFHYAAMRSDRPVKVIISLAFLVLFVLLFVGKASEAAWFPKALQNMMLFNGALFVTLVIAVVFFIGDPSGIKWNNDKWVNKKVYEQSMQDAGSTKPIWDSLENNCLIVDGPYNCYN